MRNLALCSSYHTSSFCILPPGWNKVTYVRHFSQRSVGVNKEVLPNMVLPRSQLTVGELWGTHLDKSAVYLKAEVCRQTTIHLLNFHDQLT